MLCDSAYIDNGNGTVQGPLSVAISFQLPADGRSELSSGVGRRITPNRTVPASRPIPSPSALTSNIAGAIAATAGSLVASLAVKGSVVKRKPMPNASAAFLAAP